MGIFYKAKEYLRKHGAKYNARVVMYTMKHDALIEKALHSTESGISKNRYCDHEVVVSLTTYGKRLYDVAVTIESIMQGSVKPNRIVLWLGEDLKDVTLPVALQLQQKRGLEIAFCKDIRSYKKLIPALRKYPEAVVITIDDDVIYHYDLVEKMVNAYIASPNHVIANRVRRISLDSKGRPTSYLHWKECDNSADASPLNFSIGVGGVLYPPHILPEEVLNESVFLDICKNADDVWFNAMALKAGICVKKCYTHDSRGEDFITNEDVQDVGLLQQNVNTRHGMSRCGNDIQLKAVFDKYDLWKELNR